MKNISCLSAVILLLGMSASSAQTTNIPGLVSLADNTSHVSNDSVSMGFENTATGNYSIALGDNCIVLGDSSMAFGEEASVEGGYDNIAFNHSVIDASSYDSFAANAGYIAPTLGYFAPQRAVALNYGTTSDEGAFSANYGTANHYLSAAFGYSTVTASPAQFVIGIYNRAVGEADYHYPDEWAWTPTNPVFIIGNGTAATNSNAMQVRRDGLVLINPGGNVGMGGYTNGPIP